MSHKNFKNKNNLVNKFSLLSTTIVLFMTIFNNETYFEIIYNLFPNILVKIGALGIFTIQLLLMVYSLIIYFIKQKKYVFIWIFIIGLLSQMAMLVAPYYPSRSMIVFEILCYLIIIYCIYDFINKNKLKNIIIISLVFVSALNFFTVLRGYYKNNYINKENNEILLATSKKIKNGENISKIKLKKLPDLTYSSEQPYMENYEYILLWIIEYYDLPKDIIIIYE